MASEIGGLGLRSRDHHAESFAVLLGFGYAEVAVKNIGTARIQEGHLIQEFVVVVKSGGDAQFVDIPEPAGLNRAASKKPHRGLQVNRVVGTKDFHAVGTHDFDDKSVKLKDEPLSRCVFPGNQPGGR